MKRVTHKSGTLHIETPNGIINIYADLRDDHGRPVDTIEVLATNIQGCREVVRRGPCSIRLVMLTKIHQP